MYGQSMSDRWTIFYTKGKEIGHYFIGQLFTAIAEDNVYPPGFEKKCKGFKCAPIVVLYAWCLLASSLEFLFFHRFPFLSFHDPIISIYIYNIAM